jgi:hypothetical protein
MVIQPNKQLEAEYTTITEIYDVMLSVKKGLTPKKKKLTGLANWALAKYLAGLAT